MSSFRDTLLLFCKRHLQRERWYEKKREGGLNYHHLFFFKRFRLRRRRKREQRKERRGAEELRVTKTVEEEEEEGRAGDEKHQYLAFVCLLSQSEANKELTSLRVQRQLLTLHQSHWHNRGPQLTFPQWLWQTKVLRSASRLQERGLKQRRGVKGGNRALEYK